jgi:uncharacterized protein (DUF1697 family)
MPSFVALLRGVNVGKAKRVAMAEWRGQLERLGYTDVATLLNSGNAVFRAPRGPSKKHAAEIAAALESGSGISARAIVKSSAEFASVLEEVPVRKEVLDPTRLFVVFTQEPRALAALASLAELASPGEEFIVARHAAFLRCPNGILASKVGSALLGKAGESATTRNLATVLKLRALLADRA